MLSRTLLHIRNTGPRFSRSEEVRRRKARQARRTFQPHWDSFEDRTLLSLIAWTGSGGDNNWDTPANWSSDAVPSASDDVVIDNSFAGITITHSSSSSDSVNSINSQAAIDITGGTLSIAGASTSNNPSGASTINNGLTLASTLTVSGDLTVNGSFTWSGGSTLNGSGTIDAYGGMTITGGSYVTQLIGVTINNHAYATWTGGGAVYASAGATFNNLPGATFEADGTQNGQFYAYTRPEPFFNNQGTFLKTGAAYADFSLPVINTGDVEVQSGYLLLGAGYVPTAAVVSTGSYYGSAGTTLLLRTEGLGITSVVLGDQVILQGVSEAGSYQASTATSAYNTTFSGPVLGLGSSLDITGSVSFSPSSGGPATLTTGTLTVAPGATLSGTDNFTATGMFTLSDGSTLSGPWAIDAYGGMTVNAAGYLINLDGATINNEANSVANWTGTEGIAAGGGATINNLAGATFNAQADAEFIWDTSQPGPAPAFNNAGTFTRSGDASFTDIQIAFNNTGSVNAQAGTLDLGSGLGGGTANSGQITVSPGATLHSGLYTQSGGTTSLNGGTLENGPFLINGGTLTGSGTINGNVTNAGQVIPGGTGSAGTLTVNGNYTQTATGALDVELGGTTAGSQYDQLVVSGTAALGGTLDVATINGFQPAISNTFQVLTFASSSGNFSFYNGIVLGNRLILNPTLNPSNLTLTVQPAVTTTNLSAPPSPSVSGQSVTFTATVTVALPPTTIDPSPTGTVTFYNNGTSIGTGTLSVVNGQDQASLTIATLSTASHTITAAYTSGDSNFVPSSASTAVTQVVNKANTSATVATSLAPSVHGQAVTFTATVSVVSPGSTAVASPTGTVTFYDNGSSIGTGTLSVVNGYDQATFSTSSLSTTTHQITAAYTSGDGNFNASTASTSISQVVNQDSTTTAVVASPGFANVGQSVTFTATVTANAPGSGTPTGTVDFYDTATNTDLTPGGVTLSSGTATFSTTSLAAGNHTIKASYSGDTNFIASSASTGSITIGQSIIVLDPTAGGALSLSGNANIKLTGGVYVDSSSSTALSASGNAQIKASVIDVHSGVQKSGNANLSPAPTAGAAVLADPLASLASPSTSGLTNYGSESLSGNSSATIKPGVYSQIKVSGNASLTLSSGIYIIEGGGLSVSGNASISGSGVMIVNAGSKYPTTGGTSGSITLSGSGSYNLSPPTTGTYAGIVIFQTCDNSKALTVSGNASGMTGTVYAPAAQLAESGNAALNAALIVDTLTISGNGVANSVTLSSPTGTVAYTPSQILSAYGISTLALDGTGQTIAIVDAYDDPGIFQAVDAFDSQFGLTASGSTYYSQYGPASSFLTVLNQNGQATSLPSTDPNGPGTDNWEVEEALDVEWVHAIAPGAQIVLVEANSQSLSDLMAGVATAAGQPGVSVVSMSWGFAEGQAVFAADEAAYDSTFNVPGVTFVASTGDYGAADPEYPAFSPNVVAVGGTSLTLNADNLYNSETGWGSYSDSVGAFIASGGGLRLYAPEPSYQQGVQSTGGRTIPDVSLVADPATGAWIADPYNLDPSNPFEIVGGTSLSAPVWAGLLALVNQGRATAGESTLNSSSPTDTQQALYMLPQSDYNAIASGTNGYSAGAGYNLVTGLGTPVANLLVPDLIAYQGSGTTYSGPTVSPLQNATLTNTGTSSSNPLDVFSVFDSLTVTRSGFGYAQDVGHRGDSSSPSSVTLSVINPVAAGSDFVTTGGAVGMMPLDTIMTAHDAALTDWTSSRAAVAATEAVPGSTDPGPGVSGRGVLVLGGSRTPVLQAALVDSVLEEFGALLSRDGTNPPSNQPKVKGSSSWILR